MTTIAYRDGIMVADGRETYIEEHESSYIIGDEDVKICRLPNGNLFGGSKTSEDIERLKFAMLNKRPLPKLDDVYAIMVDKKRKIWIYEGRIWQQVDSKFFAVGSGARFAIPAMMAGASALKAVKIACSLDPFSGGKITVLRI